MYAICMFKLCLFVFVHVQINPGTVGFYRIQYSSAMLESLLPGIRDLTLLPVDRLGLQNDLFSLVRRHT